MQVKKPRRWVATMTAAERYVLTGTTRKALNEALVLLQRSLPCFPCRRDKSPATPHGFKDASRDPVFIESLWRTFPGQLVGVPTGEASGFDVLDIDVHGYGCRWFSKHKADLLPTRAHRTRSGGVHLLFEHAPGLRCCTNKIAGGVDIRGDGGYIIWWPAAGLPVLSDAAVAPWPKWLLRRLQPTSKSYPPRLIVPDRYILNRLVQLVAGAAEGERNAITFWAACRAGEMVRSGLVSVDAISRLMTDAAVSAGLSAAEAQRTVQSGIRTTAGVKHG
jgi:Bifunctional DNA primase/polymerase, N-terminal